MSRSTVKSRVFSLIDASIEPRTTKQILTLISASPAAIKKALHELTVDRQIYKVRHGVYVSSERLVKYYRSL